MNEPSLYNWVVVNCPSQNFLNNELGSTFENRAYYIKDISSDRTEIRISSNILSNTSLELYVNTFINKLDTTSYFQDFYLNFGSNQLIIANNIAIDNTKPNYEILINLYEALPNQLLKDIIMYFYLTYELPITVPLKNNHEKIIINIQYNK